MKQFIILILLLISSATVAQTQDQRLSGQVSFVSSQNIYVRFGSTRGISQGDTLFTFTDGKFLPALVVSNLSTTSCVATIIGSRTFVVGDQVFADPAVPAEDKKVLVADETEVGNITMPLDTSKNILPSDSAKKNQQVIRGSISLNSYSDLSNTKAENMQRFRYTLSLNAENIAGTGLSSETYVSFKHAAGDWAEVKNDLFSALKIYSLSLSYKPSESVKISLGRRINPWLSSAGAIDGLQFEKGIKAFSLGVVAGFRPDYTNYGIDTRLFQYGAYLAHRSENQNVPAETSVSFMQQTNNFKTDRRFLYFQHSNSIVKNLNIFSTFEIDLYRLDIDSLNNSTSHSVFDLTSLYLSLRYRLTKNLSVFGSYDARKNVMYYETYRSFIDRILEMELRQGFRLQLNYRITNSLSAGIQSGYRYIKTDPHPSRNIYGFVTYNQIPFVNINATLSGTLIETSYLNGKTAGIDLTRDFADSRMQFGLGYSYLSYRLPENFLNLGQHTVKGDLSWMPGSKMSVSLYYEGTIEENDLYNRIYVQVRKRF